MSLSIYFDNAATTPLIPEVIERMHSVMTECYGNPSSVHESGRKAKTLVETARKAIAAELNVTPGEIIFTSGGTESINMILNSAVKDLNVETIITSKIEHHAVLHAVEQLQKQHQVQICYVELLPCGTPDFDHLEVLLQQNQSKKLVSLMHVNNEVGTLLDIEKTAHMCKKHDALFHSDTVQSVGHFKIDCSSIPIDFLVAAAHKFHGPKGVGFAFIRKSTQIRSLIVGGGQERGFRAGTESVHNIAGMETAFLHAYENLENDRQYITELKNYCKKQLEEHLPGTTFNGKCADTENSSYTILNACLPVDSNKMNLLSFHLDLNGIECSKGSACQSGADQGSHVLNELLSPDQLGKPSLRFSFSKFNTHSEVDRLITFLKDYAHN
jgi:cysteine desulfurase